MTQGRPKGVKNSGAAQLKRMEREAPIAKFLWKRFVLKDPRAVSAAVRKFPGNTPSTIRRIGKRWGIRESQSPSAHMNSFPDPAILLTTSRAGAALELIEKYFSEQELRDMGDIGSDVAYTWAQERARKKSRTKK